METELIKQVGAVAGIGGISLAVFLLLARAILKRDIFPTLNKVQAFRILRWLIVLSFILSFSGIIAWVTTESFRTTSKIKLQDKVLESSFRITIEGDRIIAEKDTGKIVVSDRGSCVGNHPLGGKVTVLESPKWSRDEEGTIHLDSARTREEPNLEHRIYFEVLNLFSHPVSVLEHHVVSMIDNQKIRGYVYKPKGLSAIKPGESKRFTVHTGLGMDDRIRFHLDNFDTDPYGITQAVVVLTSEGVLPPMPVRGISWTEKCED